MMDLISFVIPVYNESESLKELYRQINENVEKTGNDYEILFVNDGSTDNSPEVIRELHEKDERVHLISFRKNFGKSPALQAGFRNVKGDIVITMDSDLQDDPREIPRFIEKIHEGYDVVSGWKFNRQDPAEKKLPSKLFNKVTCMQSGITLHDFDCGFKAYRREVIDNIDLYGEMHRYIPILAWRKGFNKITEIKVHHNKRQFGHSKYGFKRYFHGLFDSLTSNFLQKYNESPMYLFGRWGLIFEGIAGFCAMISLIKMMFKSKNAWPLMIIACIAAGTGAQAFLLGLMSERMVDSDIRRNYNEGHIKEKF